MGDSPHLVTEQWLREKCGIAAARMTPAQAYSLVVEMGPPAIWWLEDELTEKAETHARTLFGKSQSFRKTPRLPQDSGCFPVLVANRKPERLPALRRAFVVPLRWVPGKRHHPRLPKTLIDVADRVQGELRRAGEISQDRHWGLRPGIKHFLDKVDLSQLPWGWGSAWASLTAGLLLAEWDAKGHAREACASADFSPGVGIQPVEGLSAKAEAAARIGVKQLFVPQSQVEE
ncbi:MAG: hypothetical protein D6741_11270, partial [Planctomycetota bacterium]